MKNWTSRTQLTQGVDSEYIRKCRNLTGNLKLEPIRTRTGGTGQRNRTGGTGTVVQPNRWNRQEPNRSVQYCTVLCSTVQYCTVLYSTVQYCTVLCSTVQYCTVLYCTVQYCTILYSTVQYCTVQYCTVPWCRLPATGPVGPPLTRCRLPATGPAVVWNSTQAGLKQPPGGSSFFVAF